MAPSRLAAAVGPADAGWAAASSAFICEGSARRAVRCGVGVGWCGGGSRAARCGNPGRCHKTHVALRSQNATCVCLSAAPLSHPRSAALNGCKGGGAGPWASGRAGPTNPRRPSAPPRPPAGRPPRHCSTTYVAGERNAPGPGSILATTGVHGGGAGISGWRWARAGRPDAPRPAAPRPPSVDPATARARPNCRPWAHQHHRDHAGASASARRRPNGRPTPASATRGHSPLVLRLRPRPPSSWSLPRARRRRLAAPFPVRGDGGSLHHSLPPRTESAKAQVAKLCPWPRTWSQFGPRLGQVRFNEKTRAAEND